MPAQGAVGAGTGATVAKAGSSEGRPGGVGIASAAAGGAVVTGGDGGQGRSSGTKTVPPATRTAPPTSGRPGGPWLGLFALIYGVSQITMGVELRRTGKTLNSVRKDVTA
jgi:hypothetical protein